MSLTIRQSTSFRRDVKRLLRQGFDLSKLETTVETLVAQRPLDEQYRDHSLIGNWKGHRECHIQPDWLLIYRLTADELQLVRTGSHTELLGR
ncbi:MAG: mRNA interferase YafQ [Chloroflexota bacterium]|nr:mRNA interferase YafQ [Chloroflexota bacterium]